MPEAQNPGLITEVPAHLRAEATEAVDTEEVNADTELARVEVGERAMRGVVVLPERPRIPIAPEDVTPQMRVNALGAPDRRDEAGRIVPR